VLEIGCGLGRNIYGFQELGFKHIEAVENSHNRASKVAVEYGCRVHTGDFESVNFGRQFDLIYSYHVLEHVYDPSLFIKKCSELQNEGDYLVLGCPNFFTEPSMGVVFFFPHLHSFTPEALRILLNKNYYEIVYNDEKDHSHFIIARRKDNHVWEAAERDTYKKVLEKLQVGLGLKREQEILIWEKDYDSVVKIEPAHVRNKQVSTFPRSMTIEPLPERLTKTPIEIHYNDELFYK